MTPFDTSTTTSTVELDKMLSSLQPGIKEQTDKLPIEYDWNFLETQLKRLSKNKSKYPKYNWKNPINIESLKEALFRHVLSVMKDEYNDEGVDYDHLAAIALNAMFIYTQLQQQKK